MQGKLKILFIHLLIVFSMHIAVSQSPDLINNIVPPSPDAASLGKYGNHEISLYTGTPSINIPLFEIKSGEVSLPISLSYHASGNRVNDVASWVGLGWSLNAGGVVTRSVKGGYHDDYLGWYFSGSDGDYDEGDKIYFAGYFYKPDMIGVYPEVTTANGRLDAEPDMFYYNTPAGTGKFFFNENKELFKIPYTPLKIEYDWVEIDGADGRPKSTFEEFRIFSTNGIKYKFNETERTTDYNYCYEALLDARLSYKNYISSWYLSDIIDSKGNSQISFSYNSIPEISYESYHTYSYGPTGLSTCSCNGGNPVQKCNSEQKTIAAKKISQITFNNGYILFHAELARQDLINDNALTKIEVYNNDGVLQKKFILNYSYFLSSSSCSDPTCRRLKLTSIVEENIDGIRKQPYSFLYNETQLPPRYSNAQDYWGYYNSSVTDLKPRIYVYPDLGKDMFSIFNPPPVGYSGNTFTLSGSNRQCNTTDLLAGTLEKIFYPTGGYSEFTFEPHEIYYLGRNRIGGGIRIKSQLAYDGISHENDQVSNYSYTLSADPAKSSGSVVTIPTYGYLCDDESAAASSSYSDLLTFYEAMTMRKSNNLGILGSVNGANIGYSEIKVEQAGNGYTIYKYNSPENYQDILPTVSYQKFNTLSCATDPDRILSTSNYPFTAGTNLNTQRGNLAEKENYNKDNQIINRISNDYSLISKGSHNISYSTYYSGAAQTSGHTIFSSSYDIRSDEAVLIRTTEETFDTPGDESKSITTINEMAYNDNYLQLIDKKTWDSEGNEIKTVYRYPYNFSYTGNVYYKMDRINQINTPIETVKLINNMTVDANLNLFKEYSNNGVSYYLPDRSLSFESDKTSQQTFFDGNSPIGNYLEEQIIYDDFDSDGNLLQYHKKNGINVSFYWGYNNNHPIAKIDNIAYDAIPTNVITELDKLDDASVNLDQVNASIRSLLPDCMVSTYTYKPVVGINTVTDPSGKTIYYEYDLFGRLETIKDQDGVVLKHIEYNYATGN